MSKARPSWSTLPQKLLWVWAPESYSLCVTESVLWHCSSQQSHQTERSGTEQNLRWGCWGAIKSQPVIKETDNLILQTGLSTETASVCILVEDSLCPRGDIKIQDILEASWESCKFTILIMVLGFYFILSPSVSVKVSWLFVEAHDKVSWHESNSADNTKSQTCHQSHS